MTFLDWMLESDSDGSLRAQVEADRADRDAGLTWGVYDGPRLVGTHPARYMAEADAFIAPCAKPRCARRQPHGSHGAVDCYDRAQRAGLLIIREDA